MRRSEPAREGVAVTVKVVTDSTANLTPELLAEHDIGIASLIVNLGRDSWRETDISLGELFARMKATGALPTSSQPPLPDLCELLAAPVRAGHDVVAFFISAAMSGTYASALAARETVLSEYPNAHIDVVDSRTVTIQLGIIVLAAARAAAAGANAARVVQVGRTALEHSRFLFVPSTLEYLRRGGRIGNAAALLGSVLQIMPILDIEDGKVTAARRVRTQRRAIAQMVDEFNAQIGADGLGDDVFVMHSEAEELAQALAATVTASIGRPVPVVPITPVVAVHAGDNAVGLGYCCDLTRFLL